MRLMIINLFKTEVSNEAIIFIADNKSYTFSMYRAENVYKSRLAARHLICQPQYLFIMVYIDNGKISYNKNTETFHVAYECITEESKIFYREWFWNYPSIKVRFVD
jgi:hypothetical protein